MDQRLRGLAQNLVLNAQLLDLAPVTADLAAHVRDDGFKFPATGTACRHER